MGAPLVALRDASLGYGGCAVLEHITLTVEQGELLALLGSNGAGKTTLLRGVAGLLPPLAGQVEYGFDRRRTPPGYVAQREALDPIFPLTAHEVVLMGTYARLARIQPVGRRQHRAATQCLAAAGLEALAEQPFSTLSGGQKQRVLIARALASEPPLLLLDEPTAGLDPPAATAILELVARLHRDQGLTVALVTHQLRLVRPLANSVLWVEDGQVSKGAADEMLAGQRLLEIFGAVE